MAALIRWEPFRGLRRREDAFEDLFRDVFRHLEPEVGMIEPAVEVSESEKDVTVKLELPGVEKDQINVSVADDALTVRGEVRKETEEKKKNYYRQEIRYGAFQRTVPLPVEVDASKAAAELKNGVLRITLPKATQPKARQVQVNVG
jgi:HSP20 family protein